MTDRLDLWSRVTGFLPLCQAARRAARGKRPSRDALAFLAEIESQALNLGRELDNDVYAPAPYHTFRIRYPKARVISAAAFRDRVVHHALCAALEPILEAGAVDTSFACRTTKGLHAAVGYVQHGARRFRYALKLDIDGYFETVQQSVLIDQLADVIPCPRTLGLARLFIAAGAPGSPPGRGLPIGNLTSQHFANFHLGEVDRAIVSELGVPAYARYMDDMLLFGDDKRRMWHWHLRLVS